ncbi:D-alanyl-D-alanine carboxypeptidase [Chryseolinea sp. T2]|uniref:D-alanyl-D-alanine carboxypeptidase/D-alanyl-D-alanine-endopeptidase n=1 Tax=Chryseolinea sp. T2 TaxID=3129255 RepID=UPI003076F3A9
MSRWIVYVAVGVAMSSCSPISQRALTREFRETEKLFHDHTGFALYDVSNNKSVFEYNSDSYFTPASNTKIFTFYSSLKLLGDSIPAFKYLERNDSLILWGTGDPSFLNRNVYSPTSAFSFLQSSHSKLFLSTSTFQTTAFGSGWAWDDYNDYYSAERSAFPVYGNTILVQSNGANVSVSPKYFSQFVSYVDDESQGVVRNVDSNILTVHRPISQRLKKEIPARVTPDLTAKLLSDTLGLPASTIAAPPKREAKIFYNTPADSVYKVMMQESDNFIAEQLLLVCAATLGDTLKPEVTIEHMKKNYFTDFPDEPAWVDGSGLSRYNLFTPRTIVALWKKIYAEVPRERLFQLLAIGGKAGTIKNYYKAPQPYIFGKTGSLSNNHCLSGYLVTRSGKTLIFSFMNSNFTTSTAEVRKNMQRILNLIYEKY